MAGKATAQTDAIDERYQDQGWKRVQMGETVIYEKPVPEEVIADIEKINQQRRGKSIWWRALHKLEIT